MRATTCPRRMTEWGPWPREEGLDDFKRRRGDGLACTFCGSMHPDDFMQAVRDGKVIGPTDKSYKAYVTEPLTDEQRAERRQQQIGRYVGMGMSQAQATTEADKDPVLGEGAHLGKFYYQHLSVEQRQEFIDLLNAKRINIGYPGRFYALPFFIQLLPAQEG